MIETKKAPKWGFIISFSFCYFVLNSSPNIKNIPIPPARPRLSFADVISSCMSWLENTDPIIRPKGTRDAPFNRSFIESLVLKQALLPLIFLAAALTNIAKPPKPIENISTAFPSNSIKWSALLLLKTRRQFLILRLVHHGEENGIASPWRQHPR